MIFDQACGLERASGDGDRRAGDAQHVGQELLRELELVAVRSVVGFEEPFRGSLLDLMDAVARHGLCDLGEERLHVRHHDVAHLPVAIDESPE